MTAGYSSPPLAKKLGIEEGYSVLFVNEPDYYLSLLDALPNVTEAAPGTENIDFIHLFAQNQATLLTHFNTSKARLAKDGIFWVSWPKKASGVLTDLDGNIVRSYGLDNGLVDVKVCAVDRTWSGLKFMYRKTDR